MPLIKEGWADALEPGIREWFFLGAQRRQALAPRLFDFMTSQKNAEHMRGVGAISPDAWEEFSITGKPASVSYDQGYKKTFTHTTYLVELPIQKELIEDNLYIDVIDAASSLGDSAMLKREVDAASVFNNAASASYLGPDGVALASDSHPNGPTSNGTQDNNFAATALTKANVAVVREAMMAFTDDKGSKLAVTPNTLLVPPALEDEAIEIAKSMNDPTSGNNTINPQFGRFEVVAWHYLTSATTWFMIDSVLMKQSLKWFDRVPLSIYLKQADTSVFATYMARMRYSFGWRDWRWVARAIA